MPETPTLVVLLVAAIVGAWALNGFMFAREHEDTRVADGNLVRALGAPAVLVAWILLGFLRSCRRPR